MPPDLDAVHLVAFEASFLRTAAIGEQIRARMLDRRAAFSMAIAFSRVSGLRFAFLRREPLDAESAPKFEHNHRIRPKTAQDRP